MYVCKPKGTISILYIWWLKNLILNAIYLSKRMDPDSQQTGIVASNALPAIMWNGLSKALVMQVVR
jgi:hypothetical protein